MDRISKNRLLIVLSVIWTILTILLIMDAGSQSWEFSDYAISLVAYTSPVWVFWSIVWIYPMKFDNYLNSKGLIPTLNGLTINYIWKTKINISKTDRRRIASNRWFIFYFIVLILATLDFLLNPDYRFGDYYSFDKATDNYGTIVGVFTGFMLIPWGIAFYVKKIKKSYSETFHFFIYTIIIILWTILRIPNLIGMSKYLGISPFEKIQSPHFTYFIFIWSFITTIIYSAALIVRRITYIERNTSKETNN